jgi:hypothetical protein
MMIGHTSQGDRMRLVTIGQTTVVRVREPLPWLDVLHHLTGHAAPDVRLESRELLTRSDVSGRTWPDAPRRSIGVQRAPRAIGRVRSHVTGHATTSDRSPESSSRDRMRLVARDQARHGVRSAPRHALPTGCVTGCSGFKRDRTLRFREGPDALVPRPSRVCLCQQFEPTERVGPP